METSNAASRAGAIFVDEYRRAERTTRCSFRVKAGAEAPAVETLALDEEQ
jgi:hypothetical protein